MRFPDQSLIGDLNDNTTPRISTGIYPPPFISTTDENDTVYDLLPVIINRPPIIIKPIAEASTPQIRPYSTADATGEFMYLFPDGTIKVNIGSSFKLAIQAIQPNVLNVENGILRLLPPSADLTYAWRKDSLILNSSTSDTLQSSVIVSGSYIEFNNIQPSSAGTYLCEISNDIGTTTSETITLEVLNLDFDVLFYRNLVKNPTGADGTNEWNANNQDLLTKPFSRTPSRDLIRPNRTDLFGYTIDMMHPRPYQIDMGVIQNFDMTQTYLNEPYYFTRTRYRFDRKNGSFFVKAYQDIDLTDIIPLIKGGIYGVEGVRALFSCYIGNGVSQYIPVEETVDPRRRTNPAYYYLAYARLSVENFLTAGPAYGINERAYVTIEELDSETRLPTTLQTNNQGTTRTYNSRITLDDPWQKRIYTPGFNTSAYPSDIYNIGEVSSVDYRDVVLNVADNLYPDQRDRFTYGQYIEFNKLIIERLNPKTTKIRVSLNFESRDWRIFETSAELINDSDEIYELLTWETPYKKNKLSRPPLGPTYKSVYERIKQSSGSFGKTPSEFFPTAQDPRAMITGLNVTLLPILTQQNTLTDYYTRITLATNTTSTSSFVSGLSGNRIFDPRRVLAVPLMLDFKQFSDAELMLNNLGYLETRDRIDLKVRIGNQIGSPNTLDQSLFTDYPISSTGLLPFAVNSLVALQGAEEEALTPEDGASFTPFNDYIRYRLISPYQSQRNGRTPNFSTVANTLASYNYTVLGMSSSIAPSQELEVEKPWINTARFVLQYGVVGAPLTQGVQPRQLTTSQIGGQPSEVQVVQSYYLDIDFSNPADTKVTLSRPLPAAQIEFELDLGAFGEVQIQTSGSKYGGQGTTPTPIELEHTITPYGELQCTIPGSLKFTPLQNGGFGLTGYRYQFTIQDRSPIRCIELLHKNLGDFSKVPLINNTYYQSRLNGILTPINNDIQILQTFPNGGRAAFYNSRGITVGDLRAFSIALAVYGYDQTRIPNASQYAAIINVLPVSSFTINIFEPFFYPDRGTWETTAINYQVQQFTAGIQGGDVGNTLETSEEDIDFDKFNIPPHLQGIRNANQKIELLAIRPADPDLGPSGTPTSGISANGIRFNVFQSPLLDSNEIPGEGSTGGPATGGGGGSGGINPQ